jgi:putative ABC transport system permease protein
MSILNYLSIALKSLMQNKVRTFLTLLGIVIGIGSVIALLAISKGATSSITSQFSALGTNTVTVNPGAPNNSSGAGRPPGAGALQSSNLTLENEVLGKIENQLDSDLYSAISPTYSKSFDISFKDKTRSASVIGVTPNYFLANSVTLNSGRRFTNNELNNNSKLIIIPQSMSEKLFNKESAIGKSVTVESQDLEVIGVSQSSGFGADRAFIPLGLMQNSLEKTDTYSNIAIVAQDGKVGQVEASLKKILLKYYNVDNEDDANFNVTTSQNLIDTANTVTATLSALLVAIGGISLLVGGIGIMNIMLVTVSERTREIGLRKALGAKISNILIQFLLEALVVTLIGGIIGIIFGWLVSLAAGVLFNFTAVLTWDSILLACGVSCMIGVVFGFYPAYNASKLQPIQALRSE